MLNAQAEHVEVFGTEPLSEAQLVGLLELHAKDQSRMGTGMNFLKRVRTSHHNLARALVAGSNQSEAAALAGYSLSRVSLLMRDPAFQELLAYYREEAFNGVLDLTVRMNGISADILDELHDRLEDDPEAFTVKDLRETFRDLADRSGYGPTRKLELDNTSQVRKDELARLKAAALSGGTSIVVRDGEDPSDNRGAHLSTIHGPNTDGTAEENTAEQAPGGGEAGHSLREASIPSHKALVPWVGKR